MEMNWIFTKVVTAAMILGILALPVFGSSTKYEIVAYDGYVAVRDGENGNLCLTATRTELLPPNDQRLLQAGIPCEGGQSVLWYLENFCS